MENQITIPLLEDYICWMDDVGATYLVEYNPLTELLLAFHDLNQCQEETTAFIEALLSGLRPNTDDLFPVSADDAKAKELCERGNRLLSAVQSLSQHRYTKPDYGVEEPALRQMAEWLIGLMQDFAVGFHADTSDVCDFCMEVIKKRPQAVVDSLLDVMGRNSEHQERGEQTNGIPKNVFPYPHHRL